MPNMDNRPRTADQIYDRAMERQSTELAEGSRESQTASQSLLREIDDVISSACDLIERDRDTLSDLNDKVFGPTADVAQMVASEEVVPPGFEPKIRDRMERLASAMRGLREEIDRIGLII